MNSLDFEVKRS